MKNLEILYEDNHIIAINKKVSDIVQADQTGDEPLSERVKAYIKEKYNKPGDVYLGIPHRVDRPVSGVSALLVLANNTTPLTGRDAEKNTIRRSPKYTGRLWAIFPKKIMPN